ncbi:MAG: N-acetylmuramoyl-L-alanine amidase [Rhodospirillaceae bacterium]|nr:N-acetylmuramoyl-L-alanine amidase [Rhodospirillaceae bacterium]MBT5565238.1 N-acetylmuramoyl-L-alanine amidase [Rhodospirillaceae bacterium]MBT6091096.1 N-acetylmuramoyl-L-alanine amidase [Rhodospirillaceae bacterium]
MDRTSPNFGDRRDGTSITMLVFHYTGMENCESALAHLCDADAEVSAHLLIDEDGTAYRLVEDDRRAWHAGASFWRGETDINSASIGIELVNPGHEYGYKAFPQPQIDALIAFSQDLISEYAIPATGVVGHSDIAPGRKSDPGELFPWKRIASSGIGLWPDLSDAGSRDVGTPWENLSKIGYARPGDRSYGGDLLNPGTAESDVISAFQARFTPHSVSGVLDDKTQHAIAAAARVYS